MMEYFGLPFVPQTDVWYNVMPPNKWRIAAMTTISVNMNEETLERLRSESKRRDTSVDELIDLGIRRMLIDHSEEVRRLTDEIIEEEGDLLRRLA
jgi:hypothetical protein